MSLSKTEQAHIRNLVIGKFGEGDWAKLKKHIDLFEAAGPNNKGHYYRRLRNAVQSGSGSQVVDQAVVADLVVRLHQVGADVIPEPELDGPDAKVTLEGGVLYIEAKRLRLKHHANRSQADYFTNLDSLDSEPIGEESATESILNLFGKAQYIPGSCSILLIQDWGAATPAHFYAAAKSIEARDFPHRLSAVIYEYKYFYPVRCRIWFNMKAACPLTMPMVELLAEAFHGEVVLSPEITQAFLSQQLGLNIGSLRDDPRFVYLSKSRARQEMLKPLFPYAT